MRKLEEEFVPRMIASGPVVQGDEFTVSAIGLDHGHIYGQTRFLKDAGARVKQVWDPDPEKVKKFQEVFPEVTIAKDKREILEDDEVRMVVAATVSADRSDLGIEVMRAGKDYFTDKPAFTTLDQVKAAREVVAETGRKYMIYYSERLCYESSTFAGQLVKAGVIGRVLQVLGLGPHRLNAASRPEWFFQKERYGGILCDIGSHQAEQFLFFSEAKEAKVVYSAVANHQHRDLYPELEDFGEANVVGDNGTTGYFRVDWFTPGGLRSWGDGRTIILGTDGMIELRKNMDLGTDNGGDQLLLATHVGEARYAVKGKIGFPFFGQLILDCLNRTELAMTQEHAFRASELALECQANAQRIE